MPHALVVDDEPAICRCFETLLSELDCDVTVTASAEEALELAQSRPFSVIVLDIRLPGMDGLTALSRFRTQTSAPVVLITAHGNLSTAVTAVEQGAFDYLPKPFELDQVLQVLRRAIAESSRRTDADSEEQDSRRPAETLIGASRSMQYLFRRIAMAARHDAPVLITGESGTGKELVAAAIHQNSRRAGQALVPVHLASLSESLLERELYGHAAGAFTGAQQAQRGLIAQADRGTLFLDEVGETPLSVQVKLLRAIESREYYPVGSADRHSSDFRLISATSRTAGHLQNPRHFRPDFFYRLAAIRIHVPPLREHRDDIPALTRHFLRQCGQPDRSFSDDALNDLMQRSWPGNVRELRNLVIRVAAESSEQVIGTDALPPEEESAPGPDSPAQQTKGSPEAHLKAAACQWAEHAFQSGIDGVLQAASRIVTEELIEAAMKRAGGNRSRAAELLGIHRETLRDRLTKRRSASDPETSE